MRRRAFLGTLVLAAGCSRRVAVPLPEDEASEAAVLTGTVWVEGKPEDRTGTTVYVLDVPRELDSKPDRLASLKIQDGKFTPDYLAVQCGQKVEVSWPENEQHNIGVSARANWQPGRAIAPDPRRLVHTFRRPEDRVGLGCNIHYFEQCYLTVVPNAYFVQTAHDGRFQMPRALPRGEYVVRAVHPRIGSSQVKVTVSGRFKTETVEIGLVPGTWSKLETADASSGR